MDEFYKNRGVVITGGAGFIGSNLAHRLVLAGSHVTIIDAFIPGLGANSFNLEGIREKISLHESDVRDTRKMQELVKGKDFLFNLSGQVSHIDSMTDPVSDMEMNVRAQLSILEACRHSNPDIKIVFTGTRQVYGKPSYLPVDEDHPLRPPDINGINKLAGEQYHLLYNNVFGVRACSLRLTNTYGPRQLIRHARQGFIGWFIRQIVHGDEITIFGDGSQQRDFNYVADVVNALMLAAKEDRANGEVFNLGGEKSISLKDLVELMIRIHGMGSYRCIPFPDDKKKIDIGDYSGNYSKIDKMLGWNPQVKLVDGLEKTIDFYRKNFSSYVT